MIATPSDKQSPEIDSKILQNHLKERLELPRAILLQLQDTCLFNPMLEQAIQDIDYLLNSFQEWIAEDIGNLDFKIK